MPKNAKPSPNPLTSRRPDLPLSLVPTQTIFCGDNLDQLRRLPDACVDLIYIDPPFNSNRNYEVFWGEAQEKRAFEDRHASTQAYIDFMRPRCAELARVLRETGSFYYHCDWHASHYVKVMLDQIIGENSFQNEIVWKRTSAHSSAKRYGPVHDVLLYYTKSDSATWNQQYQPYDEEYLDERFARGGSRPWKDADLTASGIRNGETGQPWRGFDVTAKGRHWGYPPSVLDQLDAEGRIYWPQKAGGWPRLKKYLDESHGIPLQDVWTDIPPINAKAAERIGYPTQKPVALLDRIIQASSNPDDIVLDAFCGCGTALVAASRLDRRWIGIDISPTACRVMADRLERECKLREGSDFFVRDLPHSEKQLRAMPPFEFQNWAVVALGGIPNKTKVKDMGIDGRIYPASVKPPEGKKSGEFDFMGAWYPVQVKQKDKVGRPDIDSFEAVMAREDRGKGFFVAFDYTSDALKEVRRFRKQTGRVIVPLTVREILDEEAAEEMAQKLA